MFDERNDPDKRPIHHSFRSEETEIILKMFKSIFDEWMKKRNQDVDFIKTWWSKCCAELKGINEAKRVFDRRFDLMKIDVDKIEEEYKHLAHQVFLLFSGLYNQANITNPLYREKMIEVSREIIDEIQIDPEQLKNLKNRVFTFNNNEELAEFLQSCAGVYGQATGKNDFNVQFFEKLKKRLAFYEGLEAELESDE